MYCPKCGKQIPDGSAFCPMCGQAVSAAASSSALVSGVKNGTADKLESLTQRYNAAYLFQDADRFLSIASDALPDEESTLEAMAKSVGGRTGSVIREKLNSGEKNFDYRTLLTPLIMQDAGVSNEFAGEIAGYLAGIAGFTCAPAVPASRPVPSPSQFSASYSASSSAPAPAPRPAEAPRPASAVRKDDQRDWLPVPKEKRRFAWWGIALPFVIAFVILIIIIAGEDANQSSAPGVFFLVSHALIITLLIRHTAITSSLRVRVRSTQGRSFALCSFKTKNNKKYSIAMDGKWVAHDIASPFEFEITENGAHSISLIINDAFGSDTKKIIV